MNIPVMVKMTDHVHDGKMKIGLVCSFQ